MELWVMEWVMELWGDGKGREGKGERDGDGDGR